MYIRGQEEYEVSYHCQRLQTDPERDPCLAITTAVLFQISRDPHCFCN